MASGFTHLWNFATPQPEPSNQEPHQILGTSFDGWEGMQSYLPRTTQRNISQSMRTTKPTEASSGSTPSIRFMLVATVIIIIQQISFSIHQQRDILKDGTTTKGCFDFRFNARLQSTTAIPIQLVRVAARDSINAIKRMHCGKSVSAAAGCSCYCREIISTT